MAQIRERVTVSEREHEAREPDTDDDRSASNPRACWLCEAFKQTMRNYLCPFCDSNGDMTGV